MLGLMLKSTKNDIFFTQSPEFFIFLSHKISQNARFLARCSVSITILYSSYLVEGGGGVKYVLPLFDRALK